MRFITQDRISHIIVMRHLHLIEQDHIFQLRGIAHHSAFPHQGVAADESAVAYFRILSDDGRSMDIGRRRYFRGSGNPHVFASFFIFLRIKSFPKLQDKRSDLRQRFPGIGQPFKKIRRNRLIQVIQVINRYLAHVSVSFLVVFL